MAVPKLVLCVCGAGINTSLNALHNINRFMKEEGVDDIEVKLCINSEMEPYRGRKNMVVVWMTTVDESFNAPSVQGLTFLVGGKKAKKEITQKIIALMNEIYDPN